MSTEARLRRLLRGVGSGRVSERRAMERLRGWAFEELGELKLDHHRALRKGFPEVVFGQGKTPAQIVRAAEALMRHGSALLVTRVPEETAKELSRLHPRAVWNAAARAVHVPPRRKIPARGCVAVLAAGSSDLSVAEEAAFTAQAFGVREVLRAFDVGVAGIHRLAAQRAKLERAQAVVCVAGMEGALFSVVAGLVEAPVIAVPTSVGYGVAERGLAALAAALASCSPGLMAVNIDNGFGAGYNAALIARSVRERKSKTRL
jgi:hypothetical protein